MELLLFGMITLVSFGSFVDFLIGSRGNARLKGGLAAAWLRLNEGGLRQMVPATARALGRFIDAVLAPPGFTRRYFLRTLRASVLINLLAFVVAMTANGAFASTIEAGLPHDWVEQIGYLVRLLVGYLAIVYLSDLIAWALARRTLTYIEVGRRIPAALSTTAMLTGCALAMMISNMAITTVLFESAYSDRAFLSSIEYVVQTAIEDPLLALWPFEDMFGPLYLPSLSVFLPLSVFLLTLATGLILSILDPLIRRPLSLILERAEASTKGLFTLASITLAALVSILSAASRAF
ncbi:hypothetical protein P1X14_08815 [Sphingomonas sp. AOB5]|uniref:hypothetical protein n=1 Tax=Sphingomonas sp. AOB5 TaxID=3034017 RepID=UPI0023F8A040|nr:hypothetical protein [Sphingomonas sp. AOB5]MDF7775346.1 hypothetical protein [Sphingomonas sp. AOB5]